MWTISISCDDFQSFNRLIIAYDIIEHLWSILLDPSTLSTQVIGDVTEDIPGQFVRYIRRVPVRWCFPLAR